MLQFNLNLVWWRAFTGRADLVCRSSVHHSPKYVILNIIYFNKKNVSAGLVTITRCPLHYQFKQEKVKFMLDYVRRSKVRFGVVYQNVSSYTNWVKESFIRCMQHALHWVHDAFIWLLQLYCSGMG